METGQLETTEFKTIITATIMWLIVPILPPLPGANHGAL